MQKANCAPLALPLSLSTAAPFPEPQKPKDIENWVEHACHITQALAIVLLRGQCTLFCHLIVLYFIYLRFVGEKRAPQKKVLSWKRQRMQE